MDTPPLQPADPSLQPSASSLSNTAASLLDPVKLLWAFGDKVRWKIVRELADGSALTVVELAQRLRRDANLISKHLRPLREAGAVTEREIAGADRRKSHYQVPPFTRLGVAAGAKVVDYGWCVLRF